MPINFFFENIRGFCRDKSAYYAKNLTWKKAKKLRFETSNKILPVKSALKRQALLLGDV